MGAGENGTGTFIVIHLETGFGADIFLKGDEELHAWALANIKVVSDGKDTVPMAPPEYIILRKLQFYQAGLSSRHLTDINRMLTGLGASWDRKPLVTMIQKCGLQSVWNIALGGAN